MKNKDSETDHLTSNIEIQPVHSIPKSISMEHIENAILLAYRESKRAYDFLYFCQYKNCWKQKRAQRLIKSSKGKNAPHKCSCFEGDPTKENQLGVDSIASDIVVCYPVIEKESHELKNSRGSFVHMIIHGFLHLMGYDHQDDHEEEEMNELTHKILGLMML